MSDEELWELAKLTPSPSERPVKLVYKGFKQAIEEQRTTASKWVNDLVNRPIRLGGERVTDSILVIEGEPALRRELASALTKAGFAIADVPDYPEALMKLNEFEPDMAILDELLRGGDCMEACYSYHPAW